MCSATSIGMRAPLLRSARLIAPELPSVEQLHRQEVAAVDLAEVEDLDDVRVVQARRDARLAREHLDERGRAGVAGQDPLEDDLAAEAFGAGNDCAEHLGHPSLAHLLEQDVAAEALRRARAHRRAGRLVRQRRQEHIGIRHLRRWRRRFQGGRAFLLYRRQRVSTSSGAEERAPMDQEPQADCRDWPLGAVKFDEI